MYKYLTYDEFVDTYKPQENHIKTYGGMSNKTFETYGEEQDFIFEADPKFIWTEVDGDGGCFIVAGRHYVNRIQYYYCAKPWDSEDQEVYVQLYKECDTCGCYGGYGTIDSGDDCPTCSVDTNEYNIYPDTREELAQIIGEEMANEQV